MKPSLTLKLTRHWDEFVRIFSIADINNLLMKKYRKHPKYMQITFSFLRTAENTDGQNRFNNWIDKFLENSISLKKKQRNNQQRFEWSSPRFCTPSDEWNWTKNQKCEANETIKSFGVPSHTRKFTKTMFNSHKLEDVQNFEIDWKAED
jgi:hypothetical protein